MFLCFLDVYPGVELLGHAVVLFLVFWEISILSSIVAAQICIPTNSVQGFPFLYILTNNCYLCSFWWQPFWHVWGDISLGHYAKWNKSDKERKMIWYHLYMEPKKYNKLVNLIERNQTHRSRSPLYPDAGEGWGQKENGATDDEKVGWNHQLSGHEFDQTPGESEGQGSPTCCSARGHKELDVTSQRNNNKQNKWGLTSGTEWGRIYGQASGR